MQQGVEQAEQGAEGQVSDEEGQDVAATVVPVGEAGVQSLDVLVDHREHRADDGAADEEVDDAANHTPADQQVLADEPEEAGIGAGDECGQRRVAQVADQAGSSSAETEQGSGLGEDVLPQRPMKAFCR